MADGAQRKRREPWHAVSVLPRGNTACTHILALLNRRFLSGEAPRLPLKECPLASVCGCIYRHYADRREGPRRSGEETGFRSARPSVERRAGRGRRRGDAL
jgi:hypothetical protein